MCPIISQISINIDEKSKIFTFLKTRFLKDGFYKTSMDSIASELKVSKKTIYKHFPSKEHIIKEIVQSIQIDISTKVNTIINSNMDSVSKSVYLLNAIGAILILVGEKWLEDLRIHTPAIWQEIEEFRTNKLYNTLSLIIEQGKKENLFADKPVEIMLSIFLSSLI